MKNKKKIVYYCDICRTNKFNYDTGFVEPTPFSADTLQKWTAHIGTTKHKKNTEKVKIEAKFKCNICEGYFDELGYKLHLERNKEYHKVYLDYPKADCNRFYHKGYHYPTFEAMKNGNHKYKKKKQEEQRRTRLKKAPINRLSKPTVKTIPHCIVVDEIKKDEKIKKNISMEVENIYSSDENDLEPDDFCNDCMYPIYYNITKEQKFILENTGKRRCLCDDSDSDSS